jgi:hypothetical protein
MHERNSNFHLPLYSAEHHEALSDRAAAGHPDTHHPAGPHHGHVRALWLRRKGTHELRVAEQNFLVICYVPSTESLRIRIKGKMDKQSEGKFKAGFRISGFQGFRI